MGTGLILKLLNTFKWYILAAIVIAGAAYGIYRAGEQHIQAKWDEANIKTQKEIEDLIKKSAEVTTKVETKYIDRIVEVKTKSNTIVKYVPKYITKEADANCVIPNNFILLHDAAVDNIPPEEKK